MMLAASPCNLPQCSSGSAPAGASAVADVDFERYDGTWFEIASYPQWFSLGCQGTTATYEIQAPDRVSVLNECRLFSLNGIPSSASGEAVVVDPAEPSKLRVTFFGSDDGDEPANYWILGLGDAPAGDDYPWAVVGGEDSGLWILSRTPTLPQATVDQALGIASSNGYDLGRLEWTTQQ